MFFKLKIFFSVLLAVNFLSSCNGVKPPNQLSRIAFGVESSIEKHPYIVGIKKNLGRYQYSCGGSLISSSCVLTAAHCVMNNENGIGVPISDLTISGGTTIYFGYGSYVHYVKDYRVTNFNVKSKDMDVAVIKLEKPMKGENVKTIEIDYGYENNNANDFLTTVGWGLTEYHSKSSYHLQETNVTLWSREKCQLGYDLSSTIFGSVNETITENMLCASGAKRNGVCKGDSGSLLIQNAKQVGITSFGVTDHCGWSIFPDVYTNLKSHKIQQFLNKTTQELNCWD